MKKKRFIPILLLIILFASCFGQRNRRNALVPIPDTEFFNLTLSITPDDIIETRSGAGARNLPAWLSAYINGGIEDVEKMQIYEDKYMFIGMSEGHNFTAMGKWAENFSPSRDTIMLVARRVENKLITFADLYPDDEYGAFYARMIGNAYSTMHPEAVKEDTYWIRMRADNQDGSQALYVFFVLISIDKPTLRETIHDMMTKSMPTSSSSLSIKQRSSIEKLQRNFFEGF